jgi:hemolysin activation/secretion protein
MTMGIMCLTSGIADAQPAPAPWPSIEAQRQQERERLRIEAQRQQERERALRMQQEHGVDVRRPLEGDKRRAHLPGSENPCVVIAHLVLQGDSADRFQWVLSRAADDEGTDPPIGRCLGTAGIDLVVARLQKAIVERGYTTTRVLAGPQDLSTGTLTLTLVPGRVSDVRMDDGGTVRTSLHNAIPTRRGDLLELRDIEQGLENLKRLPTVDADIQIVPSTATDARPGDSDLVVKYIRKSPLRGTLSLDDTGTAATGTMQSGATVA